MNINPELHPETFLEILESKGSIVIENFLTPECAEDLHNFFNGEMPKDWWYSYSYPCDGEISSQRVMNSNYHRIISDREAANSVLMTGNGKTGESGDISYHFYRTGNHGVGCWCKECKLKEWLLSEEMLGFMKKASGKDFKSFDTVFASKYSEGCFLSPHTDHSNGDIGFVLQLTKDWKIQNGGLLTFMSDDKTRIESVEIPKFNSLTLFNLPGGKGKWHYVSHVNPGVKNDRLAYSGWYKI